jgi:hypothetical protein
MRKNPASDRRHGSRPAVRSVSNSTLIEEESATSPPYKLLQEDPVSDLDGKPNAASPGAATVGEKNRADEHHASVSTSVHGRHRIPGYQIGGHWFFRASELDSWLRSQLNSNSQLADRVDFTKEKS